MTSTILDRLKGTSTTKAVDFQALHRQAEARRGPKLVQRAAKVRAYHDWHNAEQARPGAMISTEEPADLSAALRTIDDGIRADGRRLHAENAPAIRAALEAHVERTHAALVTAVAAMDALQALISEDVQFAHACGARAVVSEPGVSDAGMTEQAVCEWRERARRALQPPAPRVAMRPSMLNPRPNF